MSDIYSRLQGCLKCVRQMTDFVPEIGIVLGSGLGAMAEQIDIAASVSYKDIEDFPVSTVPGHKGRYVFGYCEGVPVVIMQGRVHSYEGYSMEDCVLPIRLMRLMGAKKLMLTNASGAINVTFKAGDFMVMDNHISLFVKNPLIGGNADELGTRFPDMSEIYSKRLNSCIYDAAEKLGLSLQHGVYVQLSGPSYECPAEIKLLRMLGADAVGMSTVVEAIAAVHCGMEVCGISCVSNAAAGLSDKPLTHEEVQAAMDAAAENFIGLMKQAVCNIHNLG